jgi:PAS domain S-box-containing protein
MSADPLTVRGTALLTNDTPEQYRQKIARITLDSMVQFVGLLDAEGTVLEINQVALDAVGIKLSEVEGKPFWTTFWWQVSDEINAILRESIRRAALGEFVRWDTEIYGRAGGKETIIIDASLMPVKDERGNVVFIAAEGRDITEKKAYEREIARQREELAKLDELKTKFFANISHEFRTPLTLMLGPLEDAIADAAEPLPARQRERIAMVERNGLRLQKLVNALLDFSRVEAGRIQAVYQTTDLAALTHDLASSFRAACEKAGLTLAINTPSLRESIYVDHQMWEKIVLNLVSNAFKFTLEGQIEIDVSEEDGFAVLRVSDTGTGIPEAELPRIFERFHRVEGARGRTHEGTGIGLALVKELIDLHGGTLSVESTYGQGSMFTVRIPFGHAHLPQDRLGASYTQASTATRAEIFVTEALRWLPGTIAAEALDGRDEILPTTEAITGKRAHILIADDNADMRDYLRRLLATRYEVTGAADGEEAFAAARRTRPDLILTDVMMPRLDGFGLLQKVRADPGLSGVPVIVLSARAGDEAKVEGLQTGADDYLVKPFSARELLARVESHLNLARLRQEAGEAVRHRTAQFETLLNQAPLGVYLVDAEFRVREANPTAMMTFGDISGGVIGRDFDEIVHIVWEKKYADEVVQCFRHTLQTGEPYINPERAGLRADRGAMEYYESRLDRIVLPDGRFGVVCYFRDIAQRIHEEATRQLLLNELNHRVKNTLASVQAIVQQTLRSAKDPSDFSQRLTGRIHSLARVHSLLTDTNWQGADLRELILDQLLQGPVDETRVTAWGPSIRLEPQTTLHVALMLHELGTNSIKYGALSTARGWVTVNWSVTDDKLQLRWVERGGPAISAPVARGFGTTLIEQSAKSEGGIAKMLCESEGITWEISLTLPHPTAHTGRPGPHDPALIRKSQNDHDHAGSAARPVLAGLRFLVVEDEPLIALDLVGMLEKAGAEVAPPVGTDKAALLAIENAAFDGALLDANLHGRSVDDIAAALTRRNVPFIFVTGYGREGVRSSFKNATILSKPVSNKQLIQAVCALLQRDVNVLQLRS